MKLKFKVTKKLLVHLLILFLGILSLILYRSFESKSIKYWGTIPPNNNCKTEDNLNKEYCIDKKFSKFIFLYYDGLGLTFINHMLHQAGLQDKVNLNKTKHLGISDTGPAFFSLMSGLLPLNYCVNLSNIGIFNHKIVY